MAYFVYAVGHFAQLEKLAEFDAFAAASAYAKGLRATQAHEPGQRIRVIFAQTALAAEDLLLQIRQPGPGGDE
ncbi:MAG TPA: hypothetical protein PLA97_08370 [Rubrivivax sp.]|nr:hypothetical protein [Rubrivivax sp.]